MLLVVIFCHVTPSVLGQFLFAAQDAGMTQGDYVYFKYFPAVPSAITVAPWTSLNLTGQNVTYRKQAFYSLKEVSYCLCFVWELAEILRDAG